MKYIIMCLCLCMVLLVGTNGSLGNSLLAANDSGLMVIGTEAPDYEEGEPDSTEITQEMIDEEEEWLEKKIEEINETPVEKFGSLIQKQMQRAYYAKRLELLRESPEEYFKTKTKK